MARGFTLMEMVLVIAVIGVTAAVAVPRLASAQTGARLTGAERRMISEFEAVGERAAAEGRAYCVQFHLLSGEMRVFLGTTPTPAALVRTVAFAAEPYGARIVGTNITGGSATIVVDGSGLYSATAKVQLQAGDAVRVVDLSGPVAGAPSLTGTIEQTGGGLLDALVDTLLGGLILPNREVTGR